MAETFEDRSINQHKEFCDLYKTVFKLKNVEIDYAFTNLANQSNPLYTHIFSLKVNLIKNTGYNSPY